ncbi:MAG: hypothetical protein ACFFCP_15320 [Promethearchaeota archaeon]
MKSKYLLFTFFVVILLLPVTIPTTSSRSNEDTRESSYIEVFEPHSVVSGIGGNDPLITNVVRNGGFEETDANGGPDDWIEVGSGVVIQNGSYQDQVHSGTKAGRLYAKGTSQFSGSAQYNDFHSVVPRPYLEQNMYVNFYYYIDSIPDTSSAYDASIKFEVQVYNSILTHTIYYWLSHRNSFGSGNYTYQGNILLNSSTTSWLNFDRNITSDYEAIFGAIDSSLYISATGFTVWSPSGVDIHSDFTLDDITLQNSTGYGFITNGDFEASPASGFVDYESSPSYAQLSSDRTEGTASLNMSAKALVDSDGSSVTVRNDIGYPEGYFVTGPDTGQIDFDWKYDDAPSADINQFAYFYVHARNTTNQYEFSWYLGRYLDDTTFTNTSSVFYMLANGFGSRGTWEHQMINLTDVFTELGIVDVAIDSFEFYIRLGLNAGSFVTLLVDAFSYMDYPAHDPGFEQDWYWNVVHVCTGWEYTGNPYPWQNRTAVSHSGDWAGVLDVTNYVLSGFLRDTFLQLDKDIYTSFWYRINSVVNSGSYHCYSRVDFLFDNDYHLEYYLGGETFPATMNTSTIARYYASNYGTTGTWLNLVRNPWEDMTAVFGEENWNITNILLYAYAENVASISIIFDDINFKRVDTTGPEWTVLPTDQEITEGEAFNYQIGASDVSGIGGYAVNDTDNFAIDSTGLITNVTALLAGDYFLNVSVWDTLGNEVFQIIRITVSPESTTTPTTTATPTSTTPSEPVDRTMLLLVGGAVVGVLFLGCLVKMRRR